MKTKQLLGVNPEIYANQQLTGGFLVLGSRLSVTADLWPDGARDDKRATMQGKRECIDHSLGREMGSSRPRSG
jgi:hypothetical protein